MHVYCVLILQVNTVSMLLVLVIEHFPLKKRPNFIGGQTIRGSFAHINGTALKGGVALTHPLKRDK